MTPVRPDGPARGGLAAALLLGVVVLSSCAEPAEVAGSGSVPAASSSSRVSRAEPRQPVPTAAEGRPAKSTRVRFVPDRVVLPGHGSAPVQPVQTVDGELKVPREVAHVGWWDGSAYAGDLFGHTVIAGHVDSASEGLGFFADLLEARRGDTVILRGDGHTQTYRVTGVKTISKGALAQDSSALDQRGDHRLVLITCGGAYDRARGGYDSNVVVTATPVGLAR